jgi:hypothetical protein
MTPTACGSQYAIFATIAPTAYSPERSAGNTWRANTTSRFSSRNSPSMPGTAYPTSRADARDGRAGRGRSHTIQPVTATTTVPMARPVIAAVGVPRTARPASAPPVRPTASRPTRTAIAPKRRSPCKIPRSAPSTVIGASAMVRATDAPAPVRTRATTAGVAASPRAVMPAANVSPSPNGRAAASRRRSSAATSAATASVTPVCSPIAGTAPTTRIAIRALSSPNAPGTSSLAATTVNR